MRLAQLELVRFGRLRDLSLALDPKLALVLGGNEAGKSTLREAIETVLFGFEPAERKAHPLWLWDESSDDLEVRAELALDAGTGLRVERVLQATGKSRRAAPGEEFSGPKGGNRPLDELEGTSRLLWSRIYSLDLEELRELDESVQERVDHLLLPESDGRRLHPTFEVLAALKKEQDGLWRQDRLGKPAAAELGKRIREARAEVHRAEREERELRGAYEERDRNEEELCALREEVRALEQAQADAPLLEEWSRLAERRRALPPAVDLAPLEGLPLVDPAELAAAIEETEAQLAAPRARLARPAVQPDEADARLLARREEADAFLAQASAHRTREEHLGELREEAERLRLRALRELGALLPHEATDGDLAAAAAIPLEALRAARQDWVAAVARADEARRAPGSRFTGRMHGGVHPAVLLLGLVGLAPAVLAVSGHAPTWLGVGGLAVSAAALALALLRPPGARAEERPPAAVPTGELLGPLACAPALTESAEGLTRLIETLERVQDAQGRIADRRGEIERREAEQTRWADALARFCAELALGEPGPTDALVARLRGALDEAAKRAAAAAADRSERERAQTAIDALAPGLETKGRHLEKLRATLAAAVPEEPDSGRAFAEVVRVHEERETVARRERELEANARAAALRPRLAELGGGEPPWSPRATEAREARIEVARARISALDERRGEITALLDSDPGSREASARERLHALEQEFEEALERRDRLALLASVLQRADREHRDAHQPDVLRNASRYLELVTGGRYTRPEYPVEGSRELYVTSVERDEPVPAGPPLSRGTRDQIHLCLRLGLLDHLDAGREGLPLVLDEALVNWDAPRRAAVYPLLRAVAERRQVILLTCHENLAAEAGQALGLEAIRLG